MFTNKTPKGWPYMPCPQILDLAEKLVRDRHTRAFYGGSHCLCKKKDLEDWQRGPWKRQRHNYSGICGRICKNSLECFLVVCDPSMNELWVT